MCYRFLMPWSVDARIPLTFVPDAAALAAALADGPPAAILAEAPPPPLPARAVALVSFDATTTSHAAGCACRQGFELRAGHAQNGAGFAGFVAKHGAESLDRGQAGLHCLYLQVSER